MLQLDVVVKLLKNQSWANLLFSVLRDSILDSILDSLFDESWTKSRIETRKGLSIYFWMVLCIHVHLNEEMLLVKYLLELALRHLFYFRVSSAAVIRGRCLFKRLIPQRRNILIVQFNLLRQYFSAGLNWKTSLLMKINSHCWFRTALQQL